MNPHCFQIYIPSVLTTLLRLFVYKDHICWQVYIRAQVHTKLFRKLTTHYSKIVVLYSHYVRQTINNYYYYCSSISCQKAKNISFEKAHDLQLLYYKCALLPCHHKRSRKCSVLKIYNIQNDMTWYHFSTSSLW